MIFSRVFTVVFVPVFLAFTLQAQMPEAKFAEFNEGFDGMMALLEQHKLSGSQVMLISKRVLELHAAMEKSYPTKPTTSDPENVPEHVRVTSEVSSGGKYYFSPQKLPRDGGNKRKPVAEKSSPGIYVHTVFNSKYEQYPVPKFDAAAAWQKIENESAKGTHFLTKQHKLLLAAEIHFRKAMVVDPNLIKTVKYVGLCKSDEDRIKGHTQDLCSNEKCLRTTKAKFEYALMELGFNMSHHMAIINVQERDLPLFEALLAQIFPVQILGASAVIANKEAFALLENYLKWPKRIDGLKNVVLEHDDTIELYKKVLVNNKKKSPLVKVDLSEVVEEQTARQLILSLPINFWKTELIPTENS